MNVGARKCLVSLTSLVTLVVPVLEPWVLVVSWVDEQQLLHRGCFED